MTFVITKLICTFIDSAAAMTGSNKGNNTLCEKEPKFPTLYTTFCTRRLHEDNH